MKRSTPLCNPLEGSEKISTHYIGALSFIFLFLVLKLTMPDEILRDVCGYTMEEILALKAEEVAW